MKEKIYTNDAPNAIGPYSQAIKVDRMTFLSGQIPLDPTNMTLVTGGIENQTRRVLKNLQAVCIASGGNLENIVKLTIYLTDLSNFNKVNDIMSEFFQEPYPARATIQISALPKGAEIEMDAIMFN